MSASGQCILNKSPNQFLGPGFVLRAFVELTLVAKSVNFSGHRYIPGGNTGPFVFDSE
jgi:hypothetical protein